MFDFLLLMAGSGTRTSLNYNKIHYEINNKPLYQYSIDQVLGIQELNKLILVVKEEEKECFSHLKNEKIEIVVGGSERSDSVLNGILHATEDIVLIHDAARCNVKRQEIIDVYNKTKIYSSCCLAVKVKDCIKEVGESVVTLDRKKLWQVQTPQGVKRSLLVEGLKTSKAHFLDDVEVLEKCFNIAPHIIEGRYENFKVTTDSDLEYMKYIMEEKDKQMYKIGHSNDTHRFINNKQLVLGGIKIPYQFGLEAHSDGDVVLHAISESIIGALGIGDLGTLFPDNDSKYKDMDSSYFVKEVYKIMDKEGYVVNNIDIIVFIEEPNLKNYKSLMEEKIASFLQMDVKDVNVKATRREGLGYIGNKEGVSSEAVVMLRRK